MEEDRITMTDMKELESLDAVALAELVRKKEVQAIELIDATIERIERLNPKLNAVITPMYEQARKEASDTISDGIFAGVPFLLKDFLAEYAGIRLTEGSAFLREFVPAQDSELVRRYKNAGLITVGKTNTPELAIGVTTEPRLFGPTHNPWDISRTPGGSSGGSAAAVAAGIVPMAHGNDAGGSIRIPASCCGLFGLKPTRARNPLGPLYGDLFTGLVAEHALTRSVRDSAALLDITSGPNPGDPYWAPPPKGSFLKEVRTKTGPLRIGFSAVTPLGTEIHADCMSALKDAAELCENLGHHVEEAAPTFDGELLWQAFTTVLASGFAWAVSDWGRRLGKAPIADGFEPFVWSFTERGRQTSAPEYLMALQDLQRQSRKIASFFNDHDIWLTPTLGEPPVPLETFKYTVGDPFELRRRMTTFAPFTFISNGTGQPAMSVPLQWNAEDLPVGTHFVGRFGDEATLFRLAAQLEAARPWTNRRPDISI
jgi:amidase